MSDEKANAPPATGSEPMVTTEAYLTDDERMLAELGYKQEFKRRFTTTTACAFCFSIMGVVASFSATLNFPLTGAGHVGMVWAWLTASVLVWTVAASLAELCSAYPTSGGLYYFSAKLAPSGWAPFASWTTGYMNVTGQVALVASITYTVSTMISAAAAVGSDFTVVLTAGQMYAIFVGLLVVLCILCSAATSVLAKANLLYVVLNLGTAAAVIAALAATGPHADASTAFGLFENLSGFQNDGMAFLLSLTAALWTLTGYDSASHIAEETRSPSKTAPFALISAVMGTSFVGFALCIVTSFAITDTAAVMANPPGGMPMAQVLYDHLGKKGFLAIWTFIIVVQFNTAAAQLVDASRVVYAFSRDGALPGSKLWARINSKTQTPVLGVVFVGGCSALIGLLTLQYTAGLALFSVAVQALYVSYSIPIALRLLAGNKSGRFRPGHWSLGRFQPVLNLIAVVWVAFLTIVLLFPEGSSPGVEGMNWSILILGAVSLGSLVAWLVSARHWFKGPVHTIELVPTMTASASMESEDEKESSSK